MLFKKLYEEIISSIFDQVKQNFKKMDNIKYGWMDKNGKQYIGSDSGETEEDFIEGWYLQSAKEYWKNKIGLCWDQVEVERDFLERLDVKHQSYYIEMDDPTSKNYSHTFLFFEIDGKNWFMEHTWPDSPFNGINLIEDSVDDMLERIIKESQKESYSKKYGKLKLKGIWAYNKPKVGSDFYEFIDNAYNGIKKK